MSSKRTIVIDLTQTISSEMHTFDKRVKPASIPWTTTDIHGYESELIFMHTHTGTHMDAPFHFDPSGKKLDELPVDLFVRDAVLLNIRKGAKSYVTRDDITRCEAKNGIRIGKGSAVVISTGWERHWKKSDYLSANPGLSKDAASYLVSRRVAMVGVDTANVDHPSASEFAVHKVLLPRGVLIVENLCNLAKIKTAKFKLIVLPLKIRGASGSPVRALAVIE
ncbi:MAG: cyclase family protein [Nitrososphaerales archaeon]